MSAPRRAQVAAWHHGRVEGIEVRPVDVQVQVAPGIKIENACDPANGPSKKGPSSWDDPMELKGPPAFKKRAKAHLMAYDLSGHCKALEKSQRAAAAKKPGATADGSAPSIATHTGARRGVPLLGRFLRSGHWLSLTGAPVRWQGGRKARMNETPAQPICSAVDCRRSPKEIQCIRDATLVFGLQRQRLNGDASCRSVRFCPAKHLILKPSTTCQRS